MWSRNCSGQCIFCASLARKAIEAVKSIRKKKKTPIDTDKFQIGEEELEETKSGSSFMNYPRNPEEYRIMEEIGRGTNSTVYICSCITNGETVAIKFVDLLDKDALDWGQLQYEAHTLMLLSHPNILSAHCIFTAREYLWHVMPFMAAGSLKNIMQKISPDGLEQPIIATVLEAVLMALRYLHGEGYIHRDVKADNIFLGGDGTVKLGHLGASARMRDTLEKKKISRDVAACATSWMAPEVLSAMNSSSDEVGYDFEADIWSFGITAIELAHGRLPLPPSELEEQIYFSLQVPKLNEKLWLSFKDMVSMCLVHDPLHRPTANSLLEHRFFKKHAKTPEYVVANLLAKSQALTEHNNHTKKTTKPTKHDILNSSISKMTGNIN